MVWSVYYDSMSHEHLKTVPDLNLSPQEYLAALHQSDQNNGSRVTTLETNTNAAVRKILFLLLGFF